MKLLGKGILATLLASQAALGVASAETVILDCKPYKHANVCPSHWKIDGDAKTVTFRIF